MQELTANLGNRTVGEGCPVYVIGEIGINHNGDVEIAKRLIDEAADGGADVIKFQTYRAEKIASKNSPAYWDVDKEPTKSQFQLFKKYDSFWKTEFEELKICCDQAGIEFSQENPGNIFQIVYNRE